MLTSNADHKQVIVISHRLIHPIAKPCAIPNPLRLGITPHQYVLHQRIERAKGLLQQRTISLSDIALDCGFADQNHFSKQFRKLTGVTPKTYRESDR